MIAIPTNGRSKPRQEPAAGQVLAAITGKDYLSPSQIALYQACPLKWWFAYVQKAKPELTSATLAFGSAVHAALQWHLEGVLSLEDPRPIEELLRVYREAFDKEASLAPMQFAKGDTAESLAATAKQVLLAVLETPYAWPEGQILGIEETLRVQLAPDLPDLVGRIDVMYVHEGELHIVDYKTARSMWTTDHAEESSQQLCLYASAAEPIARELDAKVKLAFVVLTKAKEPRVERIDVLADPDKVRRSTVVMRRVFEAMRALHVYPSPSQMNCCNCPYQRRCRDWHREEPEVQP